MRPNMRPDNQDRTSRRRCGKSRPQYVWIVTAFGAEASPDEHVTQGNEKLAGTGLDQRRYRPGRTNRSLGPRDQERREEL